MTDAVTVMPNVQLVNEEGKPHTTQATRMEQATWMSPVRYQVPNQSVFFSTSSGKNVTDMEAVRKTLLKGERPAVIKFDPNPLDAFYQKVVDPNLVVVQIERSYNTIQPHCNVGFALIGEKKNAEALKKFELAALIDRKNSMPWNYSTWLLATCDDESIRDGKAAARAATRTLELMHAKKSTCHTYTARLPRPVSSGDFCSSTSPLENLPQDNVKLVRPFPTF